MGRAAAREQDGRRCKIGRRGRSSLSVRSNLRTLSGVSAAAGQGPGCRGLVRLRPPGSTPPSTSPLSGSWIGAAEHYDACCSARNCSAAKIWTRDRSPVPCRSCWFRRWPPSTRCPPRTWAVYATAHARITVEPRDRDPFRRRQTITCSASVAKPLRQGRSTSMQPRRGETSRRSSSSSSARLGALGWSGVERRADHPRPRTDDHRAHAGADQPTGQPGLP